MNICLYHRNAQLYHYTQALPNLRNKFHELSNDSLLQSLQTSFGAHPASYSMRAKVKNDWSSISTPSYTFQSTYRHNFTRCLKNTVFIKVFRKIKICHQSRQLQKPSVESFSFGTNVTDDASKEKFVL
jgi:hypothetical protein